MTRNAASTLKSALSQKQTCALKNGMSPLFVGRFGPITLLEFLLKSERLP